MNTLMALNQLSVKKLIIRTDSVTVNLLYLKATTRLMGPPVKMSLTPPLYAFSHPIHIKITWRNRNKLSTEKNYKKIMRGPTNIHKLPRTSEKALQVTVEAELCKLLSQLMKKKDLIPTSLQITKLASLCSQTLNMKGHLLKYFQENTQYFPEYVTISYKSIRETDKTRMS